jgi:hypothetical protein
MGKGKGKGDEHKDDELKDDEDANEERKDDEHEDDEEAEDERKDEELWRWEKARGTDTERSWSLRSYSQAPEGEPQRGGRR